MTTSVAAPAVFAGAAELPVDARRHRERHACQRVVEVQCDPFVFQSGDAQRLHVFRKDIRRAGRDVARIVAAAEDLHRRTVAALQLERAAPDAVEIAVRVRRHQFTGREVLAEPLAPALRQPERQCAWQDVAPETDFPEILAVAMRDAVLPPVDAHLHGGQFCLGSHSDRNGIAAFWPGMMFSLR